LGEPDKLSLLEQEVAELRAELARVSNKLDRATQRDREVTDLAFLDWCADPRRMPGDQFPGPTFFVRGEE